MSDVAGYAIILVLVRSIFPLFIKLINQSILIVRCAAACCASLFGADTVVASSTSEERSGTSRHPLGARGKEDG